MTHIPLNNTAPNDFDVWVLAGQSNMEGCGWLEGALQPDERVSVFSSAGAWGVAQDPLHWFWESITPVHQELRRAGMTGVDRSNDCRIDSNSSREVVVVRVRRAAPPTG